MAGTLVIDTLKASTGVLATQNGMTGIAKAWVNFNGITTVTIRSSFNVSSVTRSSAGTYIVNFITSMADANYSEFVSASPTLATNSTRTYNPTAYAINASSLAVETYSNTAFEDYANINVAVFGA